MSSFLLIIFSYFKLIITKIIKFKIIKIKNVKFCKRKL